MSDASDEGLPIAYEVLERGVPVMSSDGQEIGTVHHVVAAPEQDIFHGLVIATTGGLRFVEAASVGALHEHQVDLRIDAVTVAALSAPAGGAPVYREDPKVADAKGWSHWVNRMAGRKDWHRED